MESGNFNRLWAEFAGKWRALVLCRESLLGTNISRQVIGDAWQGRPEVSIRRMKSLAKRLCGLVNHGAGPENTSYLEEFNSKAAEIDKLYEMRLKHIVKIDQPLVLISQIQRSGGTLLSQLFDGHPECHTHPHELYIGYPRKWIWPSLNLRGDPEAWFERLFESYTIRFFREGYQKYSRGVYDNPESFPFLLLPNLQRGIFRSCVSSAEITCQRDILDCYMTSYFNAWLDYQGLHSFNSKEYIVAFVPRVNMHPDSLERFFTDYPDGRLVSIVREPKSWYVSAHRHSARHYPHADEAIELWKESAEGMLAGKRKYGDRVYLMCFENLLQDVQGSMRHLALHLGLEFHSSMLSPTFQSRRIRADSSFPVDRYGVVRDPLHRDRHLTDEAAALIDAQALSLYEEVVKEISLKHAPD